MGVKRVATDGIYGHLMTILKMGDLGFYRVLSGLALEDRDKEPFIYVIQSSLFIFYKFFIGEFMSFCAYLMSLFVKQLFSEYLFL